MRFSTSFMYKLLILLFLFLFYIYLFKARSILQIKFRVLAWANTMTLKITYTQLTRTIQMSLFSAIVCEKIRFWSQVTFVK